MDRGSPFVFNREDVPRQAGSRLSSQTLSVMSASATENQIAAFLAKYSPAIEAELMDARARLRAFFPRGFELVFDNYNALVFGMSPTVRASNAFLSVAGYPKWATLFFLHGKELDDPNGLLEGKGKQVRSIRLKSSADINTPQLEALVTQAIRPQQAALLAAPPLATVVKMVVAKQRPRRPAQKAAKPLSSATPKRRAARK